MKKPVLLIPALILLMLFYLSNSANSQEASNSWLQWRGGEFQGVSNAVQIPQEWSDNYNILWKTSIPGKGHSSPVVSENNIVLTSAIDTYKYKHLLKITQITLIVLGLTLVTFLFLNYFQVLGTTTKISVFYLINTIATGFLLGLIMFLALSTSIFKITDSTDHITTTYRWFYSGISIIASVVLILNVIPKRNTSYVILLLTIAIFLATLFFCRPYQDYYPLFGEGFMTETMIKTGIIALSVFIGVSLLIIINERIRTRQTLLITTSTKFFQIILGLLLLFSIIAGLFGISIYRYILYSIPGGDFSYPAPNLYYRDTYIYFRLILFGIFIWFGSIIFTENIFLKYSKWMVSIIIIFVCLLFIEKNYLLEQKTYARSVICLDKLSGEIKWTKELFEGEPSPMHFDNSAATPTPILNNDTIFAYFGTPGLACLKTDGTLLWKNTDLPFYGIHGIGASPVYKNGLIIILNDMADSAYITAINAKNGIKEWTRQREPQTGTICGYRTPLLIEYHGTNCIITWGKDKMTIYELESGKDLAIINLPSSRQELSASMIFKGDTVYAFDFKYQYSLYLPALLNGTDSFIWKKTSKRYGPQDSSPAIYNNIIFMITDNGTVSAINATTGEVFWRKRLIGTYMSSVTVIGNLVYFTNTFGTTTVVLASEKFEVINKNQLPEPVYASLAPIDSQLIIRTLNHLYCISY